MWAYGYCVLEFLVGFLGSLGLSEGFHFLFVSSLWSLWGSWGLLVVGVNKFIILGYGILGCVYWILKFLGEGELLGYAFLGCGCWGFVSWFFIFGFLFGFMFMKFLSFSF